MTRSSVDGGIGQDRNACASGPRSAADISRALRDAREYTLAIYAGLDDVERRFPQLAIVNPPEWEVGHVGWFQEFWCLRHAHDDPEGARVAPRLDDADRWWNSSRVPHATRWSLPLPSRDAIAGYLDATLQATLDALERERDGDFYRFELALYHEDMHAEAMVMTLQTLALPAPPLVRERLAHRTVPDGAPRGDIACSGGRVTLGAAPGDTQHRFVFDNEKWAHERDVAPFALASRPVGEGEFAAFVDDGGYARPELWTAAGRAWLAVSRRSAPAYWRRGGDGSWQRRRFDAWSAIDDDVPVTHVNAFEAEAWCAWAGRRLPSEAEWELAALAGHVRVPGAAWEWTSSPFAPYPGFAADRYADYSEPWFRTHRVLRGGSWTTAPRLVHARFRNFYEPHRSDPVAGFRSVGGH